MADAWLAHSQAAMDADAALELAEVVARAAAISAWAAADGTPDPQLQADLAQAEAALKTVILPAGAVFDQAVMTASRQWVAAINPAATQAAVASVGAGLTYTLSVIPELATLATTLAANALQATNDLIPLAATLEQTLTDNAATWLTTITPAATQAANEQADHTAQAQLTTSNALLTLLHTAVDNSVTATTTSTAAEVAMTAAAGAAVVGAAADAASQLSAGDASVGDAGDTTAGDANAGAAEAVDPVAVREEKIQEFYDRLHTAKNLKRKMIQAQRPFIGVSVGTAGGVSLHPNPDPDTPESDAFRRMLHAEMDVIDALLRELGSTTTAAELLAADTPDDPNAAYWATFWGHSNLQIAGGVVELAGALAAAHFAVTPPGWLAIAGIVLGAYRGAENIGTGLAEHVTGEELRPPLNQLLDQITGDEQTTDTTLFVLDIALLLTNAANTLRLARNATTIAPSGNIPTRATDTLDHVRRTGQAPSGYQGGRTFRNDGRGGGQVLSPTDAHGNPITYREFDVNPYQRGVNRGAERLVIGSDGRAYFTSDHYGTFTEILP